MWMASRSSSHCGPLSFAFPWFHRPFVSSRRCDCLHQCNFAVEIWLLFSVELQGDTADRSDPLQHRQRVPAVLGILKTGNHGLRGANLLGKLGLSQTRILSHLADQESQVDLVQGALERLAVRCAL